MTTVYKKNLIVCNWWNSGEKYFQFVSGFRGKYLYEMKQFDLATLCIRYAAEMKAGDDHISSFQYSANANILLVPEISQPFSLPIF